jgi:hypothetical protein
MTLPDTIGIGSEKCGSTWLYSLLKSHPDIYMSKKRKEIDFFNRNYEKGLDWYESFFPNRQEASKFLVIGEFSPSYLYSPECAERIAKINSVQRLLLIVRNPVDQMYSYYGQAIRALNYQKSFEDYCQENPKILSRGLTGKHVKPFLDFYNRNQILYLRFEESIKDVESTKQVISEFLHIDVGKFPKDIGGHRVNQSYIPRYKKLNYLADRARNILIRQDQDWAINLAKKMGVMSLLKVGSTDRFPPMSQDARQRLCAYYSDDIEELKKMLNVEFNLY